MKNWRPDDWEEIKATYQFNNPTAFEAGADAMCKAKEEARRPVKEVKLKLIDVDWGYMSMSEFVDWMYGEV